MPSHPCDKGLTPACFRAYHKWAKQALAYKLTRLLLPSQLTRRLPGVLSRALIGPGAILPPGLVLPPGTIVPPGFTWPDHWTPWQYFDFTTLEDPRTLFPEDWKYPDPLPPGVTIAPGAVFPTGWTPADPLPAGVIVSPGAVFPTTWTPADPLPPGVTVSPGAVFPPRWTPALPLPPGVTISPTAVLPAGWTPADPPPPAFIPGYSPFPTPPDSGAAPPIYIPPFEPGPVHPPAPGPGLISYQTSIKATSTGRVVKTGATWAEAHDSVNGISDGIWSSDETQLVHVRREAPNYYLFRGFLKFSLASIPAGALITSASISIFGWDTNLVTVSLQQAPTCGWLSTADYATFSGPETARLVWVVGENTFPLNAALLAYLQANIEGNVYFCSRESLHDYDNAAPAEGQIFEQYFYNHLSPLPANQPTLVVNYQA